MKYISIPNLDPTDTYERCAPLKEPHKQEVLNSIEEYQRRVHQYQSLAETKKLHNFEKRTFTEKEEDLKESLKKNYERMRDNLGTRDLYDKIFLKEQYCPLCRITIVETLDHYLPQSAYPFLSVAPINLVPACFSCNIAKGTNDPESWEKLTLHPYYDRIQTQWLFTTIRYANDGPIFVFHVKHENKSLETKLQHHLEKLKLKRKFPIEAGRAFSEMSGSLERKPTSDERKKFLNEEFESLARIKLNYWRTAMLHAMATSEHFYKTYFENLTEN